MNFNNIINLAKDHSPSLLIGGGIATMIVGGVAACKTTFKLSDILEEHNANLDKIDDCKLKNSKYTNEIAAHDKKVTYFNTVKKVAKLYLIPVTVTVLGVSMVLAGTKIMSDRNAALAASLTTVSSAYADYRNRVIEKFGEEEDRKLRLGEEEAKITTVDEEGNEKEETIRLANPNSKGTGWLKFITRSNPFWNDDELLMKAWIGRVQSNANTLLKVNHKYTVETLYEQLGIVTDDLDNAKNMVMGWTTYDDPNTFIEFNCTKTMIPGANGELEEAYAIDPNVQCNVHKVLCRRRRIATKEVAA